MGKPFDEERAPRMDATSRAAAEIDRVHTLEARIAILETELRACTRLRAENERLRTENERLLAAGSAPVVMSRKLRRLLGDLLAMSNMGSDGECRYCDAALNSEDADGAWYERVPERHDVHCAWRQIVEIVEAQP